MSEIRYRTCDICGKKIKPSTSRYKVEEWKEVRFDTRPIYPDICRDCFDEIEKVINDKKRKSE